MLDRHISVLDGDGVETLKALLARDDRDPSWLAKKVGRSRSHIWRVLQRERPLTRPLAEACAEVFGVPVEQLLGGAA